MVSSLVFSVDVGVLIIPLVMQMAAADAQVTKVKRFTSPLFP